MAEDVFVEKDKFVWRYAGSPEETQQLKKCNESLQSE